MTKSQIEDLKKCSYSPNYGNNTPPPGPFVQPWNGVPPEFFGYPLEEGESLAIVSIVWKEVEAND